MRRASVGKEKHSVWRASWSALRSAVSSGEMGEERKSEVKREAVDFPWWICRVEAWAWQGTEFGRVPSPKKKRGYGGKSI